MDNFGMLAKDFGFRPQGKSAPMKSSGGDRRSRPASSGNDIFNDVFGGPPNYTNNNSKSTPSMSDFDYDSIFKDSVPANNTETKAKPKPSYMNSPVYDKPLYDDDIFDTIPGINSKPAASPASARYEDNIFASSSVKQSHRSDQFDDLLGNLGRTEKVEPVRHQSVNPIDFDDLIPGFGGGSPASSSRRRSDPSPTSTSKTKQKSNPADDPFVASSQTDPLEEINEIGKSRSTKSGISSPIGDVFDDINNFKKSATASPKETNNKKTGQTRSEEGSNFGSSRSSVSRGPLDESCFGYSDSQPQKMTFDDFHESGQSQTVFEMPPDETSSQVGSSPKSEESVDHHPDDILLTVSEIPLFTPVTRAPPPSRPPPSIPKRAKSSEKGSSASSNRIFKNSFSSSSSSISAKYSQYKKVPINEEEERREERAMDEEITEREKARQAVERANREARERAASEARLKAERAAVQRVQTEARERAAFEARERAERAAIEAREKAERAAAESKEKEAREKAAREKAQADAKRRAERAAVERVTAEARERAAVEARERVAAAVKMSQQKNDNDLDSFFNMGSKPDNVPKARAASSDSATDPLSQDRRAPEGGAQRAYGTNVRKAASTTNFVDDLNSIFGEGASPAGEFQDVEGETEERRRARMDRQQRTQERAAKALAEKNERDMQVQKDQEERHRISATLDVEIKRWAAGKEGNLRAMLSTLQYVLWAECGWQPISLTDLISGASVKKAYRKATLCIHPDKVQQKGANIQQKYVAEKVFDLLKEAWNKFNSEELF